MPLPKPSWLVILLIDIKFPSCNWHSIKLLVILFILISIHYAQGQLLPHDQHCTVGGL